MIWTLIHIADIILWLLMAGTVVYVMFFAFASLLPERKDINPYEEYYKTSPKESFLVIIPAYAEDSVIIDTVKSFLRQDFPKDSYDLIVVSDHMSDKTNNTLSSLPITLLTPEFENSSKAKAMQYAMAWNEKDYDNVVILDADNVVDTDFLYNLDQICKSGFETIQCHRCAKNTDNAVAMLDAVSEEINNTIFRLAHNRLEISSALIGSGMCFEFYWFERFANKLSTAGEDRELEELLIESCMYTKYADNIFVYDEKVSNKDSFQRQRQRWMSAQINCLCRMLPGLPKALRYRNVDYIDKTIQQMLIPRSLLITGIMFMAVLTTIISPIWSIKWWTMFACLSVAIIIAIPKHMRTRTVCTSLTVLPSLAWRMLTNVARIDKNNKEFIHTTHNK